MNATLRHAGLARAQLSVASLLLLTLSGCDMLGRLTGSKQTAEQTCSAQTTYDALIGIMGAQLASSSSLIGGGELATRAASTASLKSVLSFSSPTVAEVNKDTGKVSCEALLRVAAAPGSLGDQQGLSANDVGPDHVTYQVSYSVQPTADDGKPLVTLASGQPLSAVAFAASLGALRKGDDAVAAAAQPPADNAVGAVDEGGDDGGLAQDDGANSMMAPADDADSAPPAPVQNQDGPSPPPTER